jgi:hypothetical protein
MGRDGEFHRGGDRQRVTLGDRDGSANCHRRGFESDAEVVAAIAGPAAADGEPVAKRLRKRLWAEHLGLSTAAVDDPIGAAALWTAPAPIGVPGRRVCPYDPNAGSDSLFSLALSWDHQVDPVAPVAGAACCAIHRASCPVP